MIERIIVCSLRLMMLEVSADEHPPSSIQEAC
jgi:hypothetical protein